MKRKTGKVLVVGAGISGIRTALDLAETGYTVFLMDTASHTGGILSRLDYQFPTDGCGMCKMLPLTNRDAASQFCLRRGLFHDNIKIMLETTLLGIDGEAGDFEVTLRQKPHYVDTGRCIGCGDCSRVCPVEVPDPYNAGLTKIKAIHLPLPHTFPNSYTIDMNACTRCGECVTVCPTKAIDLKQKEKKAFRILVVDDELIIRESLKDWLGEEEGYDVHAAGSGPEAIDILSNQSFSLMLLDIKMPGMDGTQVLEKTKAIHPDMPVVMMTAYATVETAVEAMKLGAEDYLMKPFDPNQLIPKISGIYNEFLAAGSRRLNVGAIVFSIGCDLYDPAPGKNTFGYGVFPFVVTSMAFERMLSPAGPGEGALVRPWDKKPIKKIAWIQCVGSRDLQANADFCSGICCMHAIKEASVAGKITNGQLETVIFYMDMRAFGKSFEKYRDQAEKENNIRFERGRVHTVEKVPDTDQALLRWTGLSGHIHKEKFDIVVLSVGLRPAEATKTLCDMAGIETNANGFAATGPFSLNRTRVDGIVAGGSFAAPMDIRDSIISASSAALTASSVIHGAGGGLSLETTAKENFKDVSRELPRIMVVICTCMQEETDGWEIVKKSVNEMPEVLHTAVMGSACTRNGQAQLISLVREKQPNRLLMGACRSQGFESMYRTLGIKTGLDPVLMEVVDIGNPVKPDTGNALHALFSGISKLKSANPVRNRGIRITQSALVIGGGISGMHAALGIADHGYKVDLVEQSDHLGGNLDWMKTTLDGNPTSPLLGDTRSRVEQHPNIHVMTETIIVGAFGRAGRFFSTVEQKDGTVSTLTHGAIILATGGKEAQTRAFGYGKSSAVLTQMEMEQALDKSHIDPAALNTVVMIQCVDSREPPRNYCSRICCSSSLKHALLLKEKNPGLNIYILYRDMMTCGFEEAWYTKARKKGVVFIQYDLHHKPEVILQEKGKDPDTSPVLVKTLDPILGAAVEIAADLLVLATGVVPGLPRELIRAYGIETDEDGFFKEADSKWRPVDALKEGVFSCGLALSPHSITHAIASAQAAAQRALRLLEHASVRGGTIISSVRHSLCSLCEQCIDDCPFGARALDADKEKVLVNPAMCQGCGSCAATCPNSAAIMEGYGREQLYGAIEAVFA